MGGKSKVFFQNRKGYFFLIDALIGSTIIFLALGIILSSDVKQSSVKYDYMLAEDYSTFIMNSRMEDLNNLYINNLTSAGIITNTRNSIMEQVDEFYYNARYLCSGGANITCVNENLNHATTLVQNLTDSLISSKYGFKYTLMDSSLGRNETIYERGADKLNDSTGIIASKKITFLQINATTLFGPQIVEIKIWV